MKILFTSVGRRVELVQAYRKAAEELNEHLEIIGADITDTAPALFFCDKTVILPRIKNQNYIEKLLEICKELNVDAVIPTIDTDLIKLSEAKKMFADSGIKIVISDADKIKICRDKENTAQFFEEVGLYTPKEVDDIRQYKMGFPAFIKPKDGSSSKYAYQASTLEELEAFAGQVPDYIIQPYVEGVEYTVDAFCDFNGNPIFITPRKRLAIRAGEVLKTEISQDEQIIEEIKALIQSFKPCGEITIQLIREKNSNRDFYIEINPRYGGGAPLSIKAGADSAKAMIKLLRGESLGYQHRAAEDGAIYSRFDQSVRVK